MHTEAFTQRSFYTQKLLRHRSFQTEKLSDRETFIHKRFYTQKLTKAFAHRSFYTEKFYTVKLLHTEAFYRQKLSHWQGTLHTEKLLYTGICSSKTGSWRQSKHKWSTFQTFHKESSKPKWRWVCWQITAATLIQPVQYDLRRSAKDQSIIQPLQTLTQPLHCDLQMLTHVDLQITTKLCPRPQPWTWSTAIPDAPGRKPHPSPKQASPYRRRAARRMRKHRVWCDS